jgi:hypothetical protein
VTGIVAFALAAGAAAGGADQESEPSCDPVFASNRLNSAPLAVDDEAWVRPGEAVRIEVLSNDVDFDDDALTVESVTVPSTGSTSVEGTVAAFVADEDEGRASFQYRVSDGMCGVDQATVRVVVSRSEPPSDLAEPSTPVTSVPAYAG